MKRWGLFLWLLASCFLLLESAFAASFDPSKKWMTIKTDHFQVHYPQELEVVAKDTAGILEEVHAKLSPELKWKPFGRTEVIVTDSTDDSNGMTYIIPYNWMLLYIAPPRPDSPLANYDEWLRTLIIHEYTHLLHLDPARGFWKPFSFIFGTVVSPQSAVPGWVREGFAVYEETAQTTGGRNRASYTEMLLRAAVLEDNFPKIDEADGLGWNWPSYNLAYLFGGKFIAYLIDTYGEDKFFEFIRRTQKSPLITMVNHDARNVYHKTFYELWREWQDNLKDKYDVIKTSVENDGLTETFEIVTPKWDEQFSAPVPSPDGKKIAYIASSPHRNTEIRVKDLETGSEETVRKANANKIAWSPDGTKIAYSAASLYKRYNVYFDIYLYDFEKKKAKKLTNGERGRDPSFDPAGGEIIYVTSKGGTDAIKRLNLETKDVSVVASSESKNAHFADPKFSPDGNTIAADAWKKGDGWKIYLYSLNGDWEKRLTKGSGMETSPLWSADGRFVFYTSDESGIPNIYRADAKSQASSKITNVLTGVLKPASSDGRKFFVQEYHSKGFVISSFDAPEPAAEIGADKKGKRGPDKIVETAASEAVLEEQGEAEPFEMSEPKKYGSFGRGLLLPRFIMPGVVYLQDAFLFSATTGGADVLRRHNWLAGGTYRTDAKHFGYFGTYFYNRFRPVMGIGINDYAVDFGDLTFLYPSGETNTVHYFEERRNANAFINIPIKKHSFNVSYFYEDRMPITSLTQAEKDVLNLGIFSGFFGSYVYSDPERYPASISPENGRLIRLTGMMTDGVFGSGERNEMRIFSGDWREYVRLWHHHVLALRAAGGMTWGDRQVQGTFGLGGALGEGTFAGGQSYNYFPLRGLPVSALSRTRAMLMSAEYRVPLVSPQRGIGTWPFYIKNLHAAFFADYGNAWNAGENDESNIKTFFDEFFLGVGTELRADFILGHGLPLNGRLGYGIIVLNRDRLGSMKDPLLDTSLKYGTLILQFGTSF